MFGILDTAYAIAFAIFLAASSASLVPGGGPVGAIGTGWARWASIGLCLGCMSGGLAIVAGGPAAITAAAFAPGGALVVAGCVASCGAAIQ